MNRRRLALLSLALLLISIGCRDRRVHPQQEIDGVRLVVVIVVDQLAYDTAQRLRPVLSGGLAELLADGISFAEAHNHHVVNSTAPGHAALATGLHPRRSGIVGNQWYDRDRDEWVYCVDDDVHGTSPRRLRGTALADWARDTSWRSKAYTVSGKDRAAVLLGGRAPDAAFWYDRETGEFVSSSYYRDATPAWLEAFNEEDRLATRFGEPWTPLPETVAAASRLDPVDLVDLDEGVFERDFPHPLGIPSLTPNRSFFRAVYDSPFVDEHLWSFARALVTAEELGSDRHLDFLGISFSALDTVGHDFGHRSLEVLDTVVRLDRLLADMLADLGRNVGSGRLLVALSADHGVVPLPEVRRQLGESGHRIDAGDIACVQRAERRLEERFGDEAWLEAEFHLDHERIEEAGFDRATFEATLREALTACTAVERVWSATRLETETPSGSALARMERLYRNSHVPGRSPDIYLQWEPYHLPLLGRGTTHVSPYRYDTHVPLVLWSRRLRPGAVETPVATVDLAPTLASLLGVPYPRDLDGHDLTPLLRERGLLPDP